MEVSPQPKGTRFSKWLGILKIKVAGEELQLRPTLGHKEKLMALQSKKDNMSAEDVQEMHRIFKDILRVSYPDEPEENFDNFLLENDLEFMMALYVGFGWATEEDFKSVKEEAKKKILGKS